MTTSVTAPTWASLSTIGFSIYCLAKSVQGTLNAQPELEQLIEEPVFG